MVKAYWENMRQLITLCPSSEAERDEYCLVYFLYFILYRTPVNRMIPPTFRKGHLTLVLSENILTEKPRCFLL